jgi:hypothetical protein
VRSFKRLALITGTKLIWEIRLKIGSPFDGGMVKRGVATCERA